eukprot:UN18928
MKIAGVLCFGNMKKNFTGFLTMIICHTNEPFLLCKFHLEP